MFVSHKTGKYYLQKQQIVFYYKKPKGEDFFFLPMIKQATWGDLKDKLTR